MKHYRIKLETWNNLKGRFDNVNNRELGTKIKVMEKELEAKKNERLELVEIYDKQKSFVTKCGLSAIICIFFHRTLLQWMAGNNKHMSLKLIGMYLQPIVFVAFLILAVIVIPKAFDFFMNSQLEYGRKLTEKLNRGSLSNEIDILSKAIIYLEEESGKLQEAMINNRAEELIEDKNDIPQYESIRKTDDEWAALFDMDEEDEGSSDEMWKRDVLHL